MGELQWALLIVCIVLVVALYVFSRRGKAPAAVDEDEPLGRASQEVDGNQLDLLNPRPEASYDEYGVGRARKRGEGMPSPREPSAPSIATLLNPLPGQPRVAPRMTQDAAAVAAAPPMVSAKMVALIVAPTEETDILGPQLHGALVAQGLKFGEGDVYHRTIGGRVVYSVASLLKPGKLIPADAETFSTKGLTLVMNLPGPVAPAIAFDDMLSTTRALATALKLEIFDATREVVTEDAGKKLRAEIEDWARSQKL